MLNSIVFDNNTVDKLTFFRSPIKLIVRPLILVLLVEVGRNLTFHTVSIIGFSIVEVLNFSYGTTE